MYATIFYFFHFIQFHSSIYADNTNSQHLELYSVLGEYDNTGFPLSYCLLSTAASTEFNKRTHALASWLEQLRDQHGVNPRFVHVDKDMAEIGAIRAIWPRAKIQVCWWHLRKAIRERLGRNRLSTTPYVPKLAHEEFPFISLSFTPAGRPDYHDYEGGRDSFADSLHVDQTP
jgi:hypothetical protein